MGSYTIQKEAERIFRDLLLQDDRLGLPKVVRTIATRTTFDDSAVSTPYIPCPVKFTESSTAIHALTATFANAIIKERFGIDQDLSINSDIASLFLMSSVIAKVNDMSITDPKLASRYIKYDLGEMREPWRRFSTNVYPTKDGRWFHLHGSMNSTKTQKMIGVPLHEKDLKDEGEIIRRYSERVAQFDSQWLDIEANEHFRQAGTICYTPEEFLQTKQGKATAREPIFLLKQTDKDVLPSVPWPQVKSSTFRPLEGIKMLDISRVIAAPTIAKMAALYGATVIRISCATQPDMGVLLIDGNLGKRDVTLDLKSDEGCKALEDLMADADVVLDGYRPGALDRLGFGWRYVHEVARRRGKGIVYIRENCYGWDGPWSHRSGWQQISDCVTGVSWLMGKFLGLDEPVVPLLPNSDYQTGLIGCLGIMSALDKRAKEGGNYLVSVSLNQYNNFLHSLGTYDEEIQQKLRQLHAGQPAMSLRHYDDMPRLVMKTVQSLMSTVPQLFNPKYFATASANLGEKDEVMTFVGPAATFGKTKLGYDIGSCFLGSSEAKWPAQESSVNEH